MKRKSIGIKVTLLATVIICGILIPSACATSVGPGENASEIQIQLINQLWGKDMTILAYMEQVHPELLAGMPDTIKDQIGKKKMSWPGDSQVSSLSEKATGPAQLRVDTFTVGGTPTAYDNRVYFDGWASATGSPPSYIYFESFLKNSADTTVGSTANSGYGVNYISNNNNVMWPAAGYYHVHVWGYTISPGYEDSSHSSSVYYG